MPKQTEQVAAEVIQLVNFRLGDEEFGVDITSVREIARVADVTRIPETPSFIRGVMNLRGQVIAIVDLARQFGIPREEEPGASARIVVTEIDNYTVGILVDEVPGVTKILLEDIEPAPEAIMSKVERDYIKGVGKSGEKLIVILDLSRVLAAHQVNEVAKVSM